jgi:hypothetical protein
MSTDDDSESRFDAVDHEIRRVCSILESIAERYAAESDEALAIRDAALAYSVVQQRDSLRKRAWFKTG